MRIVIRAIGRLAIIMSVLGWSAGGFADAIADCDRLAADPHDPHRQGNGVAIPDLDLETAAAACRQALSGLSVDHADRARLSWQYARILHSWEDGDEYHLDHLRDAAKQGYPAALLMASMIQSGNRIEPPTDQIYAEYDALRRFASMGYLRGYFGFLSDIDDLADGRTLLNQAVDQGFLRAVLFRARLYDLGFLGGTPGQALKEYRKIVTADPAQEPDVVYFAAKRLVQLGKQQAGLQAMERLAKLPGGAAVPALFYLAEQDWAYGSGQRSRQIWSGMTMASLGSMDQQQILRSGLWRLAMRDMDFPTSTILGQTVAQVSRDAGFSQNALLGAQLDILRAKKRQLQDVACDSGIQMASDAVSMLAQSNEFFQPVSFPGFEDGLVFSARVKAAHITFNQIGPELDEMDAALQSRTGRNLAAARLRMGQARALLLKINGRYVDALQLLEPLMATAETLFRPGHPVHVELRLDAADAAVKWGDAALAARWLNKSRILLDDGPETFPALQIRYQSIMVDLALLDDNASAALGAWAGMDDILQEYAIPANHYWHRLMNFRRAGFYADRGQTALARKYNLAASGSEAEEYSGCESLPLQQAEYQAQMAQTAMESHQIFPISAMIAGSNIAAMMGQDHPDNLRHIIDRKFTELAARAFEQIVSIEQTPNPELTEALGPYHDNLSNTLAALEKRVAPQDPHLLKARLALARQDYADGKIAEADAAMATAKTWLIQHYNADHPVWRHYHHLRADRSMSIHDPVTALAEYEKTLLLAEKLYGPDSPYVTALLVGMADSLLQSGRIAAADRFLKRGWAKWESRLPADNVLSLRMRAYQVLVQRDLQQCDGMAGRVDAINAVWHAQGGIFSNFIENNLLKRLALAKAWCLRENNQRKEARDIYYSLDGFGLPMAADDPLRIDVAKGLMKIAMLDSFDIAKTMATAKPAEQFSHLQTMAFMFRDGRSQIENVLPLAERIWGKQHVEFAHLQAMHALVLVMEEYMSHVEQVYYGQKDMMPLPPMDQPLQLAREATAIWLDNQLRNGTTDPAFYRRKQMQRDSLEGHIVVLQQALQRGSIDKEVMADEVFHVMQIMHNSGTASTLSQMAARFAAGDSDMAEPVRAMQNLKKELAGMDFALEKALSDGALDADEKTRLADKRQRLRGELAVAEQDIISAFPRYAEIVKPVPLSVAGVQDLLQPGELLLATQVSGNQVNLVAIDLTGSMYKTAVTGGDSITDMVTTLRQAVSPEQVRNKAALLAFPSSTAKALYDVLLEPVAEKLAKANHVYVVADGALQSLPFALLLREELPDGAGFADMAAASWLAGSHAFTTLPSATALRDLRRFSGDSAAKYPYAGIGDPLLNGHPALGPRIDDDIDEIDLEWEDVDGKTTRGLFRNGLANLRAVRNLTPLPETADELRALALATGAAPDKVVVQNQARETALRQSQDWQQARILAFATHGLLAGEMEGLEEPALVLTPPETASKADDGLLTASEVATLDLDAALVILSACNTAGSSGEPGAEGLSGLARAFFFAGSRSLLVSHWPVVSDVAKALTTTMLRLQQDDPALGRSEAHRQAMMIIMQDQTRPEWAHPLFWAPFVVVGEGSAP